MEIYFRNTEIHLRIMEIERDSWLRKGVRAEHLQQMEIIEDQNESQCSEKTKKTIFNVHEHLDRI